jgi:hypothetical protein
MPQEIEIPGHGIVEFPDSMSEADIAAAAQRLSQTSQEPDPQGRGLTDRVGDALPMAGGMVGSLVGGRLGAPGRIAGAAIGGAAGQGYGELVKHATEIPGAIADVARNAFAEPRATAQGFLEGAGQGLQDAGITGAVQGGMDAIGGVAGKGLKLLGRGVYGAGAAMIPKGIKQEFPKIAEAGYREGVALTQRGTAKAGKLIGSASQAVKDKLGMMERAGVPPIDMGDVVGATSRTAEKVGKQPLRAADLKTVDDMVAALRAENPAPIKLTAAHEMKQAAQRKAQEGYRILDRGNADINRVPLDVNMDVARGLKTAIEDRVPSVGPMNRRLQELMGLERAAEHASGQSHILSRLGGAGVMGGIGFSGGGPLGAAAAAGAGLLATTPQGLTNTGLALKGAGNLSPQAVQAIRAALLAQLAAEGQ